MSPTNAPGTQHASTISSVRIRLPVPHKGVPFNKSPIGTSAATTTVDDQMAMDLTPPPVRPIQLTYGQGFQKPTRFDGVDATQTPQSGNSVYQTIKRPLRPSVEEVQIVSTTISPPVTEKPHSYWELHREAPHRPVQHKEPIRNRGPPPTTSPPFEEFVTTSVQPPVRRTSIHPRPMTTTQGPYPFETAEPDIITIPNGKDDSVYLKSSFGAPYAFDNSPKIILTHPKQNVEGMMEDILKAQGSEQEQYNTGRPSIDLVMIQAPRKNPTTTTTVEPQDTTFFEEPTTSTTEVPTTTTTEQVTQTTTTEATTTEKLEETPPPTTVRNYVRPIGSVKFPPRLSLSTTHRPITILRANSTFVKPDPVRGPILRPSISVVPVRPIPTTTTTTTEGPLNKTESIFVVMKPSNKQPIVPHQHRPSVLITRKPELRRPIDFHAVTRDEDDAFTNPDSRLVIAGVHHIQDNGFPGDGNKKLSGKVSSNGESGNIYIHSEGETGHSIDEDPSASATGTGSAEPNPDDYVVCEPGCNAAKNEKCILFSDPGIETHDGAIVKYTKCACRPGFARMFPDRPCKRKLIIFCNLE